MFPRHFFHELRTAVYDTRRVATIPGVLALLTFLIWQAPWSGHPSLAQGVDNETCRQIAAFLNDKWIYIGWLIPYFMLSRPALHDRNALWLTAPANRWTIFGARLFWTFLTTMALPTGAAYLICRSAFPAVATQQSVQVLWIQGTLLCVGAFSAFSGAGRRGLWLVAGLGALWFVNNLFSEDLSQWILHHCVLSGWKPGEYNPVEYEYIGISRTWPAVVPWVLIPMIISFWIPFKIHRAGRESRIWLWVLATCGVAILCQSAFFLTPCRTPDYADKSLPMMKLELLKHHKGDEFWMDSDIYLGSKQTALPENDLRFIQLRDGWGKSGWASAPALSGEWSCGELSGRFSPQLERTRMNLHTFWWEGEDGKIPYQNYSGYDVWVRPLRDTLGVPGVKVWMAGHVAEWSDFYDRSKPTYGWSDSDTFMQKPLKVAFSLGIPKLKKEPGSPEKPVIDPKVFAGKTLTMKAKVRLFHALPPKVLCRFPVLTGGTMTTPVGETITIIPGTQDDPGFLMRRVNRSVPIEARPKKTDRFIENRPDLPDLMLYNAKEKQAVYLIYDWPGNLRFEMIDTPDDPDAPFDPRRFDQYSLPAHAPKLSTEWFADAEFVVLSYEDVPVTLPLEFTLKVPKQK